MARLNFPPSSPKARAKAAALDSGTIGRVQEALLALDHGIGRSDLARKELGASTIEAVRAFQKRHALPVDGTLTPKTVERLSAEIEHAHVAGSKTRTRRLQESLARAGFAVDPTEAASKNFGNYTTAALKAYQKKAGITPDGRVSDELVARLREDALAARWGSTTQVSKLQRTLTRALGIAKLDTKIDAAEVRRRAIGPSTKAAIKAFQKQFDLPQTGALDVATHQRIVSVAVSVAAPVKALKARPAELAPIARVARLNMTGQHVTAVQKTLAVLGYAVDETEHRRQLFGGSTREAVLSFQRANGLTTSGHADGVTLRTLNSEVRRLNAEGSPDYPCRIRGTARDEQWNGMSGKRVQIWEKLVVGNGTMLAERTTGSNGFFDVPYDPPIDQATGQPRKPYHLEIRLRQPGNTGALIASKTLFNPTLIDWVNFTRGEQPYRGTSEFAERTDAVNRFIAPLGVAALVETIATPQISEAAQAAGLMPEEVMRLTLAHLVSASLATPVLGPAACYAFIGQHLPTSLPGDLLESTDNWTLINQLVEQGSTGLVFMEAGLQVAAFDSAITANLMPIAVGLQKDAVLAALATLRQTFALQKPILVGNGTLKGLLDTTTVGAAQYGAVATALLAHQSFNPAFWTELEATPARFGGAAAVRDLRTTVEVGHISKNFMPMVTLLKQQINNPAVTHINAPRDLAKLSETQWVAMINAGGAQVPPGTVGVDPARTYAQTLMGQSEQLFPSVSLTATLSRTAKHDLKRVDEIQDLLDQHPDFDLRTGNLDVYVQKNNLGLAKDLLTEARVVQRVHRLAPNAAAGQALLELKIHNSSQIIAMGKGRFTKLLKETNLIDDRLARTVFGLAQYQYAQILQRLTEYRNDFHRVDPPVIVDHTYGDADLPAELAAVPDLETLFGSLDYCACSHCQSVYGPAAYLADVLRYLATHDSEVAGKTVQTILFERRPDLGNIKLNCENTETPLPYIDLVCEVLENAVAAPLANRNFSFQTTLEASQLRAAPEHVRDAAYDVLKAAEFPMNSAFDLRQEEIRVFLKHLGVERWELMEAQQARPAAGVFVPTDTSIAGEYWDMSSNQTTIVTTAEPTVARQTVYWGFDAAQPRRIVAEFMRRSRLDYQQLLELLVVEWVNPQASANKVIVERPDATCNTEEQEVTKLTTAILDRMHRFLRLWRSTGWTMWELDLLIRNGTIGNNQLDGDTLVHLKQFKQLQQALNLSVEQALVFYGSINTEVRIKVDDPQQSFPPLYSALFQNPGVAMPVDPDFTLPLGGGLLLSTHRVTLLAAFGLTEADLARILASLANDNLTLANLSAIGRHAWLATGLALTVKDLLTLKALSGVADIFATPKATRDFIEMHDWVKASGFTVDELDYLLNVPADSPFGLRDEVVAEQLDALREALRGNTAPQPDGTVTAQVATVFAVSPEQARLFIAGLRVGGQTLLAILTSVAFTARNAANDDFLTPVTAAAFPAAYAAWRLLHKASLLITRLAVTRENLTWLLQNAATFSLLAPGALPTGAAPAAPLFPAWLALVQWLHLDRLYAQPGAVALRDVFDRAALAATPVVDIRTAIAARFPWNAGDVATFAAGFQFQHAAGALDYARVRSWLRLATAFDQLKRIGAPADQLIAWSRRDVTAGGAQRIAAQQARQTAKAKYDAATWLKTLTPLEDALREKKRDALIAWMVESSLRGAAAEIVVGGVTYANPLWWQDADDLLRYFLIDVQMSACQPTSRIKQAMSSVQMFVQRCLLGRERPYVEVSRAQQLDVASENSWKQWEWMKSYRIWEANRKVFLYPENWIEPGLRDDKSPFFEELESDIMQHDITDENVEAAFLSYVQKVHEIARLDIVGAYHELDDTDPSDLLPPDINRLHVIGRSRAHPAVYYYRQFDLNYGEWTAWEKIDLDIESEQVTPVVYNRKLYLFWLTFQEKPQKVRKQPAAAATTGPTDAPEPPSQLELQLAWSARKDGGWTAKRVSRQRLIHPWQRPLHSYNLKPRYKSRENQLWLDVYISQSVQFNNGKFWDAYKSTMEFVTHNRYDETRPPWHSSSFVFDGQVVDVRMKGLIASYRTPDANGIPSGDLTTTNSYEWVHTGFGPAGGAINRLTGPYEIGPRLPLPSGMHYDRTRLANNKTTLNAGSANVLERGQSRTLLNAARSPFEVVFSQHHIAFDTVEWGAVPFFYQDGARAFFIRPEWPEAGTGYNRALPTVSYRFYPFYHPYTALFMRELNRTGLDGLLNRRIQVHPETYYPGNNYAFSGYSPTAVSVPDATAVRDTVDFERYGACAIYNWEIFFHAPLMIACKLSANQRFAEAMRWFHYIFDPTNADSPDIPQRYWITRPFYETNSDAYRQQRIEVLLKNIDQHKDQLIAWKNHPFRPHLIARYRPIAYQKTVVMKYLDNLIAWADQLYRRDTIESINEATTLYVIAHEILGRKPVRVPNVDHADLSYNELVVGGGPDPFGNKRVDILMENFTGSPVLVTRTEGGTEPLPTLDMFYFAIPNNDRMLEYWATIEQRLFNIRNCRNIAGVYRQLPLFEPPIDPALLVKAAAAGVDLSSILDDLAAPASPYRFQRLAQRAMELCGEVKALGDKLLGVLEKRDAEGLSLLRSTQELVMHKAVRDVRKQQIREARENQASLERSRTSAEQKETFYGNREFINGWETTALTLGGVSAAAQTAIALGYILSGGLALIPRFTAGVSGFGGSPEVTVDPIEGLSLSKAASDAVATLGAIATAADKFSALAATVGSYQRRQEEWSFQARQATAEIRQIDKQIAAAEIRLAIAEKEEENQELQIENAEATDEYMRAKYTNQQLYDWHVGQVASLYFQCYKLAYDTAKRAEKCFQFELGRPADSYVEFGYWDSLKKGLLAGERLAHDIRRMEAAYLDQNTRQLEITKHISLAQFQPLNLMSLKENGTCTLVLPEWLFDMDYPGHIRRRIKSLAVSIPCVAGPYTSINCTLTLTNDAVRLNNTVAGVTAADYGNALGAADIRFARGQAPVASIVTSHGQNDAGMFDVNLNDERYLAFEGAGAVSQWTLTMPRSDIQFDPATIADVVLHLRYTAQDGGSNNLATAARANLAATLPPAGRRLLVLNQDFATEWHRFLVASPGADQALSIKLTREHLPFWARSRTNYFLTGLDLIVESTVAGNFKVKLTAPALAETDEDLSRTVLWGDHHALAKAGFLANQALLGDWQLKIRKEADPDFHSLKPDDIQNAYLVLTFRAT